MGGHPAEVWEAGQRAAALEGALQVLGAVQTAAVWAAGLQAEACLLEELSVGCQFLVATFGRPLEEG